MIDADLPLLDSGEAAAISLTRTLGARFVLSDEIKARRVAASLGLQVVGNLWVLLRAKQFHLLPAVRPVLEMMHAQGRWFSEALMLDILNRAGE